MRRRHVKKTGSLMALTLVASMGITSLSPALNVKADDSQGKYYGSFTSMEDAKKAAEQLTKEIA